MNTPYSDVCVHCSVLTTSFVSTCDRVLGPVCPLCPCPTAVGCVFTFGVWFSVQELYINDIVHFPYFFFCYAWFCGLIKEPLPNPVSSKSFTASTFESLVQSELIFIYGVRYCSNIILFCVDIQLSQHHLSKRLFFFHWIVLSFVENQLTTNVRIYIWTLNSVLLTCLSGLRPIPHSLGYCSFV